MTSTFDNWARNVRQWPWNLVGLVIMLALFVISIGLFYEDFSTSLEGYRQWPTAKANAWVIFLVALLPQLGQIGFGYAFMDRKVPVLFLVLMLFAAWDMTMDIYYKSYQFETVGLSLMATVESILLYTLGSELLLAFSLGMLFRIVPGFIHQIGGSSRRRTSARKPPPVTHYTPPTTGKVKVPPIE